MRGEIEVPGKDLCDMSGNQKGRTPEQFTLYNVMLPRKYYPALQGNLYERRCKVHSSITHMKSVLSRTLTGASLVALTTN